MTPPEPTSSLRLQRARRCLEIEIEALAATRDALEPALAEVIGAAVAATEGGRKLLFSGVGKSAHIALKLAATFNSIGSPSCFLDATHALHGDLGLCAEGDLAFLLSNSGATEEVVRLVPMLRRFSVGTVAVTSRADSPLAAACDLKLIYQVPREACPLSMAPTASTTAALAIGDAVAVAVMEETGITPERFARYHPAGAIGRTLLLRVGDIMRSGEKLPAAAEEATVQEAILSMTRAKAGSLALVDRAGKLSGIFTDGDFRRAALQHADVLGRPVAAFMTRAPVTVTAEALAVDAWRIFQQRKIDDLIVVDAEGRPVGLVDSQDLPKLKVF